MNADLIQQVSDQVWERVLARDPMTALRYGTQVDTLWRGGPGELADNVSFATGSLAALAGMPGLQAAFVRDHLEQEVAEQERFWFRLPVTPYNSMVLSSCREVFATADLCTADDVDRYLSLLEDYAAVVEQMVETMAEQRRRGIRLPVWAVEVVTATMASHRDASVELVPSPPRRAGLSPAEAGRLANGVARIRRSTLADAFGHLLGDLERDETEGANGTGIGQYPGGAECYQGLIRLHTGLDLTAEEVHELGVSEVERITERIRSELGIDDEPGYRQALIADPANYAQTPADVERVFQQHIDRLEPLLSQYFARLPDAPFRLSPLEAGLGALTFGYYQPPGADGVGYYRYNASGLSERPLLQAASVICHEGMPGHHMQVGRQFENTELHPIRRVPTELRTFALTGYMEGWAEYAAGFCDEIGLYSDPVDRYGRMCAERFQASRLVVDTGLNVLGWSREQAAGYLRAKGSLAESEIPIEVLRYALDDPGQALGYHVGNWYLRELRGGQDPREFHEQVLAEGPLPLATLGSRLTA